MWLLILKLVYQSESNCYTYCIPIHAVKLSFCYAKKFLKILTFDERIVYNKIIGVLIDYHLWRCTFLEIILYLSAALAAIAFFILVIYLTKTLKALQVTLDSVSTTLIGLEKQLQGLTTESTLLLNKTNALAEDIQKKSENLNSVVDAVKDVGTSIKSFNTSLQKVSVKVEDELIANEDKIAQVVQWGNAFFELKDLWQRKKAEKNKIQKENSASEENDNQQSSKKRFLRTRG